MRDITWILQACHAPETELGREALRLALDALVRLPEGRVVLGSIFRDCHLIQPTYTGDTLATAFKEGQRSVATDLFHLLTKEQKPEEEPEA